jgi:regulatory protein
MSGRRALRVARPRALDLAQARAVALDLLSRRAWTHRDLVERLARRGAPTEVARAIVADLEARGYVDDRAFAQAWAETRARGKGLGNHRLRDELLARGVARPTVEAALRQAGLDADEEVRARAAAARRLPALRRVAPAQAGQRLYTYLLRRGFPAGVVRRVVRQACSVAIDEVEEQEAGR